MHETMRRRQSGRMAYYTCDRLPVRHAFTTKSGGVSTGDCESLNFGFNRGDDPAHVRQNYKILTDMLGVPLSRTTPSRCIGTRSSSWRSVRPAPV